MRVRVSKSGVFGEAAFSISGAFGEWSVYKIWCSCRWFLRHGFRGWSGEGLALLRGGGIVGDAGLGDDILRSPVLLTTPDEWQTWITGSPDDAFKLIRPIAPERLRIVQEGFEKKDLLAEHPA